MAPSVNSQAKPAVIRVDPLEGRNGWGETLRVIPAWIISAAIHGILIFIFIVFLSDKTAQAKDDNQDTGKEEINTKVEAKEDQQVVLTNEDEGINPEVPANYEVNRIEEVSVPGMVDPNAAFGIAGEKEGPPVTIPSPPGSGGGQGGAPDDPNIAGAGMMNRTEIGGLRGLRNTPGGFAGRSGSTREKTAMEGGGSKASEAAVAKGLKWLALHQSPEGCWSLDGYNLHARESVNSNRYVNDASQGKGQKNDTAGAAFGLLPYLAAGITHKPSGRPQDDQYVKTVQRALNYLMTKQGKDGEFPGGMYAHGLATITMCEAFGLTADPMLKKHAQAAINYIIKSQDPAGGGWRYQPRQGGDTSVVGWQVMALKSGQMSGLNVPKITLDLTEKYLTSCESTDYGGYGYVPGSGETPTMSAVGLLCRQYLGTPRRNPGLRNGVEKLQKTPPSGTNIYYEYYATQVFHHMGGDYWDFWNGDDKAKRPGMRDILVKRQEPNGSWDPRNDVHSGAGGRIMQTSLSLLTLEVYYRHLPLYQRVDTKK